MQIWNEIEDLAKTIKNNFEQTGTKIVYPISRFNWQNDLYSSSSYRRAHLEVVDKRQDYKIYILHCTIFPYYNDPSPIWGFDVICGANKITGAFLDFSSSGDPLHPMMNDFSQMTKSYQWNKPRELPEWAKAIFSPAMVAAGNLKTLEEVDLLKTLCLNSLDYYLKNVGKSKNSDKDYRKDQNRYCHFQKQNPQVIRSMVAMGVDEQEIRDFVEEVLFPEST